MSETDLTDDWMNPPTSSGWTTLPQKTGIKYAIMRQRRVIVTGPTGSITQWDQWMEYDTAAERDKALKELREQHPVWRLKAATRNYDMERLGIYRDEADELTMEMVRLAHGESN